jgi:hypothetical protein
MEDASLYKRYRNVVDGTTKIIDEKAEMVIWKTTSSQVTSMLLASLGYSTDFGDMIGTAIRTTSAVDKITNERMRDFRLAHMWQETFLLGKDQPGEKLHTDFFPKQSDRALAAEAIERAREGATAWLDRGKNDITPATTPHFFSKKAVDPNLEIPDELQDVFSIEELTKMDENDFDALIDQIDEEQKVASKRDDVISNKAIEELEKQLD